MLRSSLTRKSSSTFSMIRSLSAADTIETVNQKIKIVAGMFDIF